MKRSTLIPVILLVYLTIMAYIGLDVYHEGRRLLYVGVIAVTLVVIVVLRYSLKRQERLRHERERNRGNGAA